MRALSARLRPRREGDRDRGVALLVVIGVGMVMLVLVATGLSVAINGLKKTNTDQDFNGAMDAAYAGVEEYQSRLATDNSYYTYGNPAALFSKAPISSSSVTLPTGAATNPAFGLGTTGTWATVPNSTPVASYRYEVDNSHYAENGSIRIRVTGRVGEVTRSIVADLKQSGFIDFLYFTDFEVQDPQLTGKTQCADLHIWQTRPSTCTTIQFGDNDTFEGPVHSNDTLTICGSDFEGKVTTANPKTPVYIKGSGCSNATWAVGTGPYVTPSITMPPTNVEIKKETRNDLSASQVPIPGCLYTGPTVITYTADGKMNVKSPWTLKTNISETSGVPSSNPAKCGVPGIAAGGLGSTAGATLDVLAANVIYVQNVPLVAGDPNYSSSAPANFTCVNSNRDWTFGTTQFPAVNEITPDGSSSGNPAYGCKNGDVFVKGVFKGANTIAAENYIYVTGDLTYNDDAKDILGLVGNGAVWVWNPMKSTNGNVRPLLTDSGRTIEAAILSVAHTFQVQNYDQGSTARGTLTVRGSIAQKYRGTVAYGTVGYIKDYQYDTRFAYMAPPKFLSPVSSAYGVTQFAGVPTAFTYTGATP